MKNLQERLENTHEWIASTRGQKGATMRLTADEVSDLLRAVKEQVARDLANELPKIHKNMLR